MYVSRPINAQERTSAIAGFLVSSRRPVPCTAARCNRSCSNLSSRRMPSSSFCPATVARCWSMSRPAWGESLMTRRMVGRLSARREGESVSEPLEQFVTFAFPEVVVDLGGRAAGQALFELGVELRDVAAFALFARQERLDVLLRRGETFRLGLRLYKLRQAVRQLQVEGAHRWLWRIIPPRRQPRKCCGRT